MTDKNSTIKERHLSCNHLLLKGNGNVQQLKDANKSDDRRNGKGTGSENERADKTFDDRGGTKPSKRPRPLLSQIKNKKL